MVKLIVVAALVVHGAIHLMGVAKAFGLAELEALTRPISRPWGVAWAACAALILGAAVARLIDARWWWMLAAPGLIASQIVVVAFWADARFGTVANIALILPVVVGFGSWRFANRADAAVAELANAPVERAAAIEPGALADLPAPVATWLERAGVVGRARTASVHLSQRGELQTKPGGGWMSFRAEQWIRTGEPGFVWVARVAGPAGTHLSGIDRYLDGAGSMRIELLSVIPVVDESGPRIDQSALVRFLAEAMWYPSAALAPYIEWEAIDANSARATVRHRGVEARGVFRFNAGGDVIGFEARRYRDEALEDWIIENDPGSFRELDGVRIPARSSITWRADGGEPWTWLHLEVVSLERDSDQR